MIDIPKSFSCRGFHDFIGSCNCGLVVIYVWMAKKSTGVLRLVACRTLNSLRSPRRRSRLRFPVKRMTAEHMKMFFSLWLGTLKFTHLNSFQHVYNPIKVRITLTSVHVSGFVGSGSKSTLKGLAFLASCNEDVFMLVIYEVSFEKTGL